MFNQTTYRYVTQRTRLLHEHERDTQTGLAIAISAGPILIYVIAMAVADVSTAVSIWLYFSVPILYFVVLTVLRERRGTRSKAEEFS